MASVRPRLRTTSTSAGARWSASLLAVGTAAACGAASHSEVLTNARCPSHLTLTGRVIAVRLSDVEPIPSVRLAVGDRVTVLATLPGGGQTTTPYAATHRVLCESSTVHGRDGSTTATFVAVRVGATYVGATISGVPGGVAHPALGARITVVGQPG